MSDHPDPGVVERLNEYASRIHHQWQHPTFEYGSERCGCPFIPDLVVHTPEITRLTEQEERG